jgi:hypothetical protein
MLVVVGEIERAKLTLSTRCRDARGVLIPALAVATRARWRVDSDSWASNSKSKDVEDVCDGAGERGKMDDGEDWLGTIVGYAEGEEGVVAGGEGRVIPVGRPCAARALTTASQPFSSVLIRSLSSSFSLSLFSSSSADLRSDKAKGKDGTCV